MKIYTESTAQGCTSSLFEVEKYRTCFSANSYENVYDINSADIIVLNTCAFSSNLEDFSLQKIEKYQKLYPNKKIVVGGCLTKINKNRLKMKYSDQYYLPDRIDQLCDILDIKDYGISNNSINDKDLRMLKLKHKLFFFVRDTYTAIESRLNLKLTRLNNIIASAAINSDFHYIKVSDGCLGKCTYCAIKKARGSLRSRPLDEILKELDAGLSMGNKKIWLLAHDLGCWGQDINSDVTVLLEHILKRKGDFQVIINFFEPSWIVNYFDKLKFILSDKRMISLYVPLHSGSKRVINKMGREYDPIEVSKKLNIIRQSNNNLILKTNFLIGFSGESHKEFMESTKLIKYFDITVPIKYTVREGTSAAKYHGHHHEITKNIRVYIMYLFIISNKLRRLLTW